MHYKVHKIVGVHRNIRTTINIKFWLVTFIKLAQTMRAVNMSKQQEQWTFQMIYIFKPSLFQIGLVHVVFFCCNFCVGACRFSLRQLKENQQHETNLAEAIENFFTCHGVTNKTGTDWPTTTWLYPRGTEFNYDFQPCKSRNQFGMLYGKEYTTLDPNVI